MPRFVRLASLVCVLTALAMVSARPASAQTNAASLSARDSAQIRAALLRVVRDSILRNPFDTTRVWIRLPRRIEPDGAMGPEVPFTEGEWAAISAEAPSARGIEPGEELFLCPPGERVRMPGNGCPIREDGMIVSFGAIKATAAAVVESDAGVIRSRPRASRTSTWGEGIGVRLRRTESGEWELIEVLWRNIT